MKIKWHKESQKEIGTQAKLGNNGNRYSFNLDLPKSSRRTIIDLGSSKRNSDSPNLAYASSPNSTVKILNMDGSPKMTFFPNNPKQYDLNPA